MIDPVLVWQARMRLIAAVLLVTSLCWLAAADASFETQIFAADTNLQFNCILLALSTWTGALHVILLYLGVSGRLAQPEPTTSMIGDGGAQTDRAHQGDSRAAA